MTKRSTLILFGDILGSTGARGVAYVQQVDRALAELAARGLAETDRTTGDLLICVPSPGVDPLGVLDQLYSRLGASVPLRWMILSGTLTSGSDDLTRRIHTDWSRLKDMDLRGSAFNLRVQSDSGDPLLDARLVADAPRWERMQPSDMDRVAVIHLEGIDEKTWARAAASLAGMSGVHHLNEHADYMGHAAQHYLVVEPDFDLAGLIRTIEQGRRATSGSRRPLYRIAIGPRHFAVRTARRASYFAGAYRARIVVFRDQARDQNAEQRLRRVLREFEVRSYTRRS